VTQPDGLVAAVSAAVVDAETEHRRLLRCVVGVARAIFAAAASSIFLVDEASGELVFEAVSGAGEDDLVGVRFPANRGIAGWVLASQEPMIVEELATNPAFARDIAETTGYVPSRLMAAPLLDGERAVGVLEVLDPAASLPTTLAAIDLLTMFSELAAVGLGVLQRNRAARLRLYQEGADIAELVTLARALTRLPPSRRTDGLTLLGSVTRLLNSTEPADPGAG
jgi:GAF domain-containing protein